MKSLNKIGSALSEGIRIFGDPILRKKAKPVKEIGEVENKILEEMARLMYAAQGCGLAGPQAGIDLQLLVVDVGGGLLKLANPRIVKKAGADIIEEGCLSLPEISVKVKRFKNITLECLSSDNKVVKFEAREMLSRALQHEIDHLHGKLIIDYAPWSRRVLLRRKLKRIAKQKAHG
jgi:peptide deformylase